MPVKIRCVGGRFDGINFNWQGAALARLFVWDVGNGQVTAAPRPPVGGDAPPAYPYARADAVGPGEIRYRPILPPKRGKV